MSIITVGIDLAKNARLAWVVLPTVGSAVLNVA